MTKFPARKNIRLKAYDYSEPGGYFVTICSFQRKLIFGEVKDQVFLPSNLGLIILDQLNRLRFKFPSVQLGVYGLMPNHLHLVVYISDQNGPKRTSLPYVVSKLKVMVTVNAQKINFNATIWQRNYYEHVIRDSKDEQRIVEYIQKNPLMWAEDENYPERMLSGKVS